MIQEPKRTASGAIVALTVLVLGLIGLLLMPYVSFGVAFAILILEVTIVCPIFGWAVRWLAIQSEQRREEEALRRGDAWGAAEARARRQRYERLGRWW
jgi:hypothetical protein